MVVQNAANMDDFKTPEDWSYIETGQDNVEIWTDGNNKFYHVELLRDFKNARPIMMN